MNIRHVWKRWSMAWLLLWWGLGAAATAAAAAGGGLMSAEELRRQLGQPGLRVIDARWPSARAQQHIPGAVRSDLFTMGPSDTPPAALEAALRRWGVAQGDRLVLVDEGGSWEATRLYWDLLQAGLPAEALHILDGGMARWRAVGAPVAAAVTPAPGGGNVVLGAPRPELQVRLSEFLAATADPQRHVMLEALDPEYYYGGAAFFSRGGHVPHATLMPSGDFFNADKTFKSPAELRRLLAHKGVRPDQEVLTYCGGGGAAAVPFFALKALLGHERVRLFTASQFGWLQDPRELPVWTYARPALLRDTDWVKGWASPMLQRMGLVKTAVVDLRPAPAFERGHVPLAMNLPIDQWLAQAAALRHDVPALARWVAAAGVQPDARVVLVSEGGITEDAALALLLLEQAGHPQASVWLDNLDRWIERGLDVATGRPAAMPAGAGGAAATRTASAPSASAAGTGAAPASKVGADAGAAVAAAPLLADVRSARGLFPTVAIASGPQPSAPPPLADGDRALHLPYTRLLGAQGQPLPAAALWQQLAQAGVPRYARIVLHADTPGPAAVSYLLLRLMGFADVKVWWP